MISLKSKDYFSFGKRKFQYLLFHLECKDHSDFIQRNISVMVNRRIRGTVDTLTPSSNQLRVISSDDIIKR
jgi:hypothetical protein